MRTLENDDGAKSSYHLKWISWNSGKIPIVMQSVNGPCPLIATMNVLLLREKIKLPNMLEQITANQLLTYLGECIMDSVPADMQNDENAILNLEQNIHDAIEILPKLKTGLDVNIRFTGITDFEYTPECIIFDLLRIPLYHGWLIDPTLIELQNAIGNQSYNQLVDNIITNKSSSEPETMAKVLIAEEFLHQTASQFTNQGLKELKSNIKDNEIGILFRNNHFLTLFKREGELYTLVTDHGYLTEDNIIWETLDNIEGAGRFLDSEFSVSSVTNKQVSEFRAIDSLQKQVENDFFMALSLDEEALSQVVKERENDNTAPALAADTTTTDTTTTPLNCQPNPEYDLKLAKKLQDDELKAGKFYEGMNYKEVDLYQTLIDIDIDRYQNKGEKNGTQKYNPPTMESPKVDEDWPRLGTDSSLVQLADSKPTEHSNQQPSTPPPETKAQYELSNRPSTSSTALHEASANLSSATQTMPSPQALDPKVNYYSQEQEQQHNMQQQQQPPLSSNKPPHNQRRLKSEKNSKEPNCIVS